MTGAEVLEVTVHIAATPDTVFPYFIDPDRYAVDGRPRNIECGAGRRIPRQDGGRVEAAGEFVEVDPPRRVVFTWGWTQVWPWHPGAPEWSSRSRPRTAALGGARHYGLPDDELRAHHRKGWRCTWTGPRPRDELSLTGSSDERIYLVPIGH